MRLYQFLLDRLRPLRGAHRQRGRAGERVAERYLRQRGYRLLGRNLRSRVGELDLLMESPEGVLVVVEVKARVGRAPVRETGRPEARVNAAKRRKIAALASQLARRQKLEHRPWRFDVVGVDLVDGEEPAVRHHIAAFDAGF